MTVQIEKEQNQERMNLTKVQNAIWSSQNMFPSSALFNIGGYAGISGKVDVLRLESAIRMLLLQHNALRITIVTEEGLDQLTFDGNNDFILDFLDFSDMENADQKCKNWIEDNFSVSASLEKSFFFTALLKANDDTYYWYVKVHHLIADGYSLSLIFNHVTEIYDQLALEQNQLPDTGNLIYDFRKHIREGIQYLHSDRYAIDKLFWLNKYASQPDNIPFDRSRILSESAYSSKRKKIILDRSHYNKLCALAAKNAVPEFHYFLTLFYILINKLYDQENVVVGIPLLNRNGRDTKQTIGAFLNILPLSIQADAKDSFFEITQKIREEITACYRHSKFPLIDLMEDLNTGKPLYNTLFSFEKNGYSTAFDGNPVSIHHMPRSQQLEDLSVHILDYNDSWDVTIIFDYREQLFTEEQIDHLAKAFYDLMLLAPDFSDIELKNMDLSCKTVRSGDQLKFSAEKSVVQLIDEQCKIQPDKTAIVSEGKQLTYSQVVEQSLQIASCLQHQLAIQKGDLIAVAIDRDTMLIPLLIGILRTGAAYLPIDLSLPADRVDYYLTNSLSRCLLTNGEFVDQFQGIDIVNVNNLLNKYEAPKRFTQPDISLNDLAYVMYTSGSTGKPKGVEITHGNLLNFLLDFGKSPGIESSDKLLATTTFAFDISVLELFLPLTKGAEIHLVSNEVSKNPAALMNVLTESNITVMQATPSTWRMLLSNGWQGKKDLKVISGGEYLHSELGEQLMHCSAELWNMYGPTETTIWSLRSLIKKHADVQTLGEPVANTQIYILNQHQQQLPDGFAGEIFIGGSGVSRGYRNNSELTEERFIQTPFHQEGPLYRTGDFGKWMNGQLYFMGRKDDQVKVRGYRIELGEIENVLSGHEKISHCVVTVHVDVEEEKSLVCYYSLTDSLSSKELRTYLKQSLPDYMLPDYFVELESLPLTTNGKVDKKRLPSPSGRGNGLSREYVAAKNSTESTLVELWSLILGEEQISTTDDFFELGGHSLKVIRLKNSIYASFGVVVALRELFEHSTLFGQALLIASRSRVEYEPLVAALR